MQRGKEWGDEAALWGSGVHTVHSHRGAASVHAFYLCVAVRAMHLPTCTCFGNSVHIPTTCEERTHLPGVSHSWWVVGFFDRLHQTRYLPTIRNMERETGEHYV